MSGDYLEESIILNLYQFLAVVFGTQVVEYERDVTAKFGLWARNLGNTAIEAGAFLVRDCY